MLKWLLIGVVAIYAAVVALLYIGQRSLMYLPRPIRTAPAAAGLPQAQEVVLTTSDGVKVIAWYVPPRGDNPIVIYFHGNAEIVAWRVDRHRKLVMAGVGLLALSYRGYAGSTGQPTEEGLHRDAQAAYDFAVSRYPPDRIALWGHSLGTGVAVRLASEHPIDKLVLEAPYTSTTDIAAMMFPFVPVRLLMKDQFHSDEIIGRVTAPIMVLHGARDNVIPIRFGERLFGLINSQKQFMRFPNGGHIDLDDYGATEAVLGFLMGDRDR